jgi:hypothetical protein
MLNKIGLLSAGLVAMLATGVWGRGEFRLGGHQGNSWQAMVADQTASYVLLDTEDNIVRNVPVSVVTEEASVRFSTAGVDTLIDFADNGLRPVWIDPKENLTLSIKERQGHFYTASIYGGTHLVTDSQPLQFLIDGDPNSAMLVRVPEPPRLAGINNAGVVKNNVIHLGAELPINRIRFFPRPGFEDNYLAWYEIGVADHTAPFWDSNFDRSERGKRWYFVIDSALGAPNDPAFDILERNTESLDVVVDLRFPTRDLKWVAIRPLDPERDWEIAELEVYGEGFVTRTTYRTWIMDFGHPIAWSKIRWEGDVPEGTRLLLRTRTGNSPQPNVYQVIGPTGTLEESNLDDYQTQLSRRRWDDVELGYDLDNWSFWSAPYEFEAGLRQTDIPADLWQDGTSILSPSPARYFQLEVVMFASGDKAPRIDNMSLLFAEDPVAQEVVGEIWPIETNSFEAETFTYVVRPVLGSNDLGFDRLEIFTQIPVEAVRSVLIDGEEVIDRFPPEIQDDRLIVSFDRLVGLRDNRKQIEVVFDAKVLRFGAEFKSWVYDSTEPELKQQVAAGNATFRFGGDVVSVRTPMGGDLISRVRANPPTFSPNGDGINDQVKIEYELRDLESLRQINFGIYDLSGWQVRQIVAADTRSGSFEQAWDGRDAGGDMVPPGLYIYQLDWNTDKGSEVASGVVGVVY